MPRTLAVAAQIYHAATYLYPPEFRREFGEEMVQDFDEAEMEAWRTAEWRGVLALWAHTFRDLAWSALLQWLRSRLPAIAVLSMAFAVLSVTAAAQLPRVALPTPLTEADRDLLAVMLLIVVVLLIVVAVIVLNLWFSRTLFRRPSRPRF